MWRPQSARSGARPWSHADKSSRPEARGDDEVQLHLHRLGATAQPAPLRPAKIVQLEARRQARLGALREYERVDRLPPPRPAA